jgi:hypothetical protein
MSIQIVNGIQLSAFDVELLTLGKLIAVPFIQHRKEGQVFWLYPSQQLPFGLSAEQYYQPEYLANAKDAISRCATLPIQIKAWGRCEYHWRINPENKHLLPKIAQSTVWNVKALEHIFDQHRFLKLLILRAYRLSKPCIVNLPTEVGAFYWPQSEDVITMGRESDTPVVSQASFNRRKALLLAGEMYPHTNLEALQFQIEQSASDNPASKQLNQDIKQFLGWTSDELIKQPDSDLAWIQKIAEVGNSSDGQTFEKLVRRGLFKLGFRGSGLDPDSTGGAGGMDFYCETPYPIVGECKATKTEKVPDGTPAQLLKLGMNHLGKAQYDRSIKLIVAAGELTSYALRTATENQMNVIRPETLQRLVELQAQHKNSIDLLELKLCLQQAPFGLADDKVNSYIDKVNQNIKLRSHLVQLVKKQIENTGDENVSVDSLHGAYVYSNPPQPLKREAMHEILIELSSPLTGYLGRIKGSDWTSDRFYFLRDLKVD